MIRLATYRIAFALQGEPTVNQEAYDRVVAAIRELPGLTAILESGVQEEATS